jgi:hypothetical protein
MSSTMGQGNSKLQTLSIALIARIRELDLLSHPSRLLSHLPITSIRVWQTVIFGIAILDDSCHLETRILQSEGRTQA